MHKSLGGEEGTIYDILEIYALNTGLGTLNRLDSWMSKARLMWQRARRSDPIGSAQLAKSVDAVPLTRNYITDWEHGEERDAEAAAWDSAPPRDSASRSGRLGVLGVICRKLRLGLGRFRFLCGLPGLDFGNDGFDDLLLGDALLVGTDEMTGLRL